MIFDCFAIDAAEDTVTAHTLRVDGKVVNKGTVLSTRDTVKIKSSGQSTVSEGF